MIFLELHGMAICNAWSFYSVEIRLPNCIGMSPDPYTALCAQFCHALTSLMALALVWPVSFLFISLVTSLLPHCLHMSLP